MIKKNIYIYIVVITLAALSLLFTANCGGNGTGPAVNPNLMTAQKTFSYSQEDANRFKQWITAQKLEKMFLLQRPNINYNPKNNPQPWTGRVKFKGVSYHGVFGFEKSTVTFKLADVKKLKLTFTVFNPAHSRLYYTVVLKQDNKKINLFKQLYEKETLEDKTVNLDRGFNGPVELVFETKGKGAGAWLNPFLLLGKKKPRLFVVIVLDTLRADHTSLYRYKRKTTPVLDRLAQQSRVFDRAYSTTSWTLPAHVSLFSGKNLDEHHVVSPGSKIGGSYPLVAEVFQQNGFVTAAFTGGGFIEDGFGFYRGFQLYSNNPGSAFSINSAERVFDHFQNYIKRFSGNDMFIFLHTYQPHAPYKAPGQYTKQINPQLNANLKGIKNYIRESHQFYNSIDPKDRQLMIDLYDASILYCDRKLIGSVVDYLKEKKIFDQSMLVVLSDHGEEFYDHQSWEHGHTLYNELIKIPLLVKYPNNRLTGREKAPASITDIPGIMLAESGLAYDKTVFKNEIGKEKRILPVLLPVSPIIPQFPPKISFVNQDYHFIFNIINPKTPPYFDPPPPRARTVDLELYEARDYLEKTNLAKRRKNIVNHFGKLVSKYLQLYKGLNLDKFKIDKDLEDKLKSLGYLGN